MPQGPKLLKTLLFESSSVNPLWSECLVNIEINNLLEMNNSPEMNNLVEMKFPNGATTKISRDILMMFE